MVGFLGTRKMVGRLKQEGTSYSSRDLLKIASKDGSQLFSTCFECECMEGSHRSTCGPATSAAPASPPAETQKNKTKKASWWRMKSEDVLEKDSSGPKPPVSAVPDKEAVASQFVDIKLSRFNNDSWHKSSVLTAFRDTVAASHPEFDDDDQKDAHEFLVCALDVLQCEFSKLQAEAAALDKPSICPVRAHIGFTMLRIQLSVILEW